MRIKRNFASLKKLKKVKDKGNLKKSLKCANSDLIAAIVECAANLLENKVPVSYYHKRKLIKHKGDLLKLAKFRHSGPARNFLVQKGGAFLPLLLAPALSAAASLLTDLILK